MMSVKIEVLFPDNMWRTVTTLSDSTSQNIARSLRYTSTMHPNKRIRAVDSKSGQLLDMLIPS